MTAIESLRLIENLFSIFLEIPYVLVSSVLCLCFMLVLYCFYIASITVIVRYRGRCRRFVLFSKGEKDPFVFGWSSPLSLSHCIASLESRFQNES